MNTSGLHCCEKVEDEDCKQECITAFKEHDSVNDIIDRVEKACGPVDLMVSDKHDSVNDIIDRKEKACGPVDLMVSDIDQPARQGCNKSL